MTDYRARVYTYRPIENSPENTSVLEEHGIQLEQPEAVAVLTVELDRIETILPSMAEFNARYEFIEVDDE